MSEIPIVPRAGRWFWASLVAGAAGLLLTLLATLWMPREAFASYLTAFCYWGGIAVGALLLIMSFHAVNARWVVVLRRVVEAPAVTLPLFAVLFVPIALGLSHLYPWAGPNRYVGGGVPALIAQKSHWLSPGPFVLRAGVYFVLWVGLSETLYAWSKRQDVDQDVSWLALQRRVGTGGLPVVGVAMTLAAFDWLMSLKPDWGSTIFGVYWFAGSFLAAHAVVIIAASRAEDAGLLRGRINASHYLSLGKLLFAFICFWAYIGFSQFLLVWIANRPNEISWYAPRVRGPYLPIALALVFGKFLLPFFVLLSKRIKFRPHALSAIAVFILGMQYVDVYWLVMPAVDPTGGFPRWTDLTAVVGIGGLATAFALWRVQGLRVMPARDPYLSESLRYRKT